MAMDFGLKNGSGNSLSSFKFPAFYLSVKTGRHCRCHDNQSLERTWVISISNTNYSLTLPYFNIRCVIICFGQSPTVFIKNYVKHVTTLVHLCRTAPSAQYTRPTQRLSRPPPIQKLGAENHMLQLNI